MHRYITVVLLTLVMPPSLRGQAPPAQPQADEGFGRHLFPPELIMQHRRTLNITSEQRTTITTAIQELQSQIVELQWQLQDETEQLESLLQGDRINETAALEQVDRVLGIENLIKRAHLRMLIRIRNVLTPLQLQQLEGLRRNPPPPDAMR